ncbi:DUF4013 domain-containing protein [Methanobrevibacter sp.]|uniref:DUF4013 domain-containing protein n=1 Tax=Methanobrevibacter sp. TaxID=66852 RepID=UPI00388F844C
MNLGEIFSDAIRYPFSDITNFLIVGVLAVLASLTEVVAPLGIDNGFVYLLAVIIGFIFSLIIAGYSLDVIKKGIEHSNDFPAIDLEANLINGIKAIIISIVYLIIPIIISFIIMALFGVIGAGIDHVVASLGIASIIIIILFILFGIFEMIALAKFADTRDLGAALNIGAVLEDAQKIGIVKIIVFVIVVMIVALLATIIISIFAFIPYIGLIIATLLLGAFALLFASKALGLLYSNA